MAGIKDGGPAFARSATIFEEGTPYDEGDNGMSLRDYFAAKALAGVMANANPDVANMNHYRATEAKRTPLQQIAVECYAMADAMLAEREKGK